MWVRTLENILEENRKYIFKICFQEYLKEILEKSTNIEKYLKIFFERMSENIL